jgi:methionyl-tRNA synthetase
MLMSAGLPVPRQVFGHGFMTVNGQKMSKSLGTAIDPIEAAQKFGSDPLRLYLMKEIAFGGDGDFTWERYEDRYNVDLANNLGNLVSRIAAMADKYRGGRLSPAGSAGRLKEVAAAAVADYRRAMEGFALEEGAAAGFRLVDAANGFIAETEPWVIARDGSRSEELSQVLFDVAEALRVAAVLLWPFMPGSAAEILRRIGEARPAIDLTLGDADWSTNRERVMIKGPAMWPRVETNQKPRRASVEDQAQVPSPAPRAPSPEPPPSGPGPDRISIDDFMKVELRTAKVLSAEKVPNSRKLIKLSIDVGSEQRTLVAGIAEAYEPEHLVGRTVVMVFNLKPAKLMGIESNGMVLAASPDGGTPTLVGFDTDVPPGTRVR